MFTSLREERAREIFQEFDTNSDGIIDMDELKAMLTALGLEPKDEDDFDRGQRFTRLNTFSEPPFALCTAPPW